MRSFVTQPIIVMLIAALAGCGVKSTGSPPVAEPERIDTTPPRRGEPPPPPPSRDPPALEHAFVLPSALLLLPKGTATLRLLGFDQYGAPYEVAASDLLLESKLGRVGDGLVFKAGKKLGSDAVKGTVAGKAVELQVTVCKKLTVKTQTGKAYAEAPTIEGVLRANDGKKFLLLPVNLECSGADAPAVSLADIELEIAGERASPVTFGLSGADSPWVTMLFADMTSGAVALTGAGVPGSVTYEATAGPVTGRLVWAVSSKQAVTLYFMVPPTASSGKLRIGPAKPVVVKW